MSATKALIYVYSGPNTPNTCCNTPYLDHKSWLKHLGINHQKAEKKYLCTKCNSLFEKLANVSTHYPHCKGSECIISLAFKCEFCSKSYDTKIGLGVHQRSKHPSAFEEKILSQSSQTRTYSSWSSEHLHILADKELAWDGTGHINIYLGTFFPERTIESVKGQRKSQKYKTIIENLKTTLKVQIPPLNNSKDNSTQDRSFQASPTLPGATQEERRSY